MISAAASTAPLGQMRMGVHPGQAGLKAPGEAGGAAVDGAVANALTQGLTRAGTRQEAADDAHPRVPAMEFASQARAAASGFHRGAGVNLTGFYQELLAACAARPKEASGKSAGTRYRAARCILG